MFHLHLGLYLLQAQPASTYSGSVWTQLLTALVVGLLTAFALQFLVTNLGIAIGISFVGMRATESDAAGDRLTDAAFKPEDATAKSEQSNSSFSTMAGLGILLTVNLVLFCACFLAAKFSQVSSPMSGAIAGIVIWSAYLLLLLWISSTAVSSLVGSVLGAATGGVRRIVSTISSALSGSENEVVTQEQMIATIREEMQAALDVVNLRQLIEEQMQTVLEAEMPQLQLEAVPPTKQRVSAEFWQGLEAYLLDTRSDSLTPKRVDRKLQKLLKKSETEIPDQNDSLEFDRTILAQWLNEREDLTDKKKRRILDQLEQTWNEYWQEPLDISDHANWQSSEEQSEQSPGFSQVAALLLEVASDPRLKQLLPHLSEILQQLQRTVPNWGEAALVVIPAVLAKVRQSADTTDSTDTTATNYAELKQYLEPLIQYSQSGLDSLNHALVKRPIERLHDQSMQQIEAIQQSAQERIGQVKQQAQQRLRTTRNAAATAAWWLFLTATTGAVSSALAGALAAGFRIVD